MKLLSRSARLIPLGLLALTFVAIGSPTARGGLQTGLEAYYHMDGDGFDSSGNGYNLTVTGGAGYGLGLFGQALSLNNDPSQYAIQSGDNSAFNFGSSDFTIQLWVNFNTFGSSIQTLIEKFTGETGPGWTLTAINNSLQFYADGMPEVNSAGISISAGSWNQIIVERDGTTLGIYLNGSLLVSDSSYVGAMTSSSLPLLIGNRNSVDGRNYDVNGRMDEIAIWDRALSTDEIASLWNNGQGMLITTGSVPEPSGIVLAGLGMLAGFFHWRSRNNRNQHIS